MKKILSVTLALFFLTNAFSQEKTDWSKVVIDRAGDHFLMAFSYDNWTGVPDSIRDRMSGFPRGFNIALMISKPFQSDPRWSVAFGLGISHSSIFFEKTKIDLISRTIQLPFKNLDTLEHFKKYKLATTFAEIPIELRYTSNPVNQKKAWKLALGVKVGTMLDTHTKGKNLQDKNNNDINDYTEKIKKRSYFNSTRLAATARAGIGNFSVYYSYSITSYMKDVAGPPVHPYQIGLCLSGL